MHAWRRGDESALPLPADPAALRPDQRAPHRATEKRQVLREQQQAQRQHPYPQYGKEAEQPAEHQQQAERDAQPRRAGRAQPDQDPVQPAGQHPLEAVELMIEPMLVAVHGHSLSIPGTRLATTALSARNGWLAAMEGLPEIHLQRFLPRARRD